VPLSLISFSCQIPDTLLKELTLKKISRNSKPLSLAALKLIKQEVAEDFNLNIKVATIYRCSLLQITNNARRCKRVGLEAEVPYTDGSTVIVTNTLLKILKNLLLTTKLPHSKAQELSFKENGTISHLYDNLNFSYKI
jgi:hypothetical protein